MGVIRFLHLQQIKGGNLLSNVPLPASRRQSLFHQLFYKYMYWTLELAHHLKKLHGQQHVMNWLFIHTIRRPLEVIENLQEMEEEGELFESIEDIWPDYPRKDDFLFNEDEYWRNLI